MSGFKITSRSAALFTAATLLGSFAATSAFADMAKYDADNNGALSGAEYMKMGMATLKKQDADGDGALSLDEFTAMDGAKKGEIKRAVKRFPKVDKDGNGALDKKEMKRVLKYRFKKLDHDENGEISQAEMDAGPKRGGGKKKSK